MKNNKLNSHGASIGLGIAAVVAAATAGAYFLYGSAEGPARRKALKSWVVKMKGDVMEEVENMQDISEDLYHSAIDKISKKYSKIKKIDPTELTTLVKSLKSHWKDIKKEAEKTLKVTKKIAKKATK